MDKTAFLNYINYEDRMAVSNLYEKMVLCEKTGKVTFAGEFFPPIVWSALKKAEKKFGCQILTDGVFDESERRMVLFFPYGYDEDEIKSPVKVLKIKNKSKFDKLEHKDYLGALMAIGIKREKFGDMIVENNECFIPVSEDIAGFISATLENAGRVPVEVEIFGKDEIETPKYKFREIDVVLSSMRADAVISAICNVSRSEAVSMLESGKVTVNYESISDKDFDIKIPATISIRKYGKYIIEELKGETKKGRLKLNIKKYI